MSTKSLPDKFSQKDLYAFAGQGVDHVKSLRAKLERRCADKNLSDEKRNAYKQKLQQVKSILDTLGK